MAYLITCSGSKREILNGQKSKISDLSFDQQLRTTRELIIEKVGIKLDWTNTTPAYQLYSGKYSRLYPQVSLQNWERRNTNILILSALFGWIRHTDKIPYYDLEITDWVSNLPVWKFWLEKGNLNTFISEKDIDLLSPNYRKAISKNGFIAAQVPKNVHFTDRGVQKGKWLNNQLNNSL